MAKTSHRIVNRLVIIATREKTQILNICHSPGEEGVYERTHSSSEGGRRIRGPERFGCTRTITDQTRS
jgi:hypothetical protein